MNVVQKILQLVIPVCLLAACDQMPEKVFLETESIETGEILSLTVEGKTGNYFVFAPEEDSAVYEITLSSMDADFDLVLGTYETGTPLSLLPVQYTSKNMGIGDESIEAELDSSKSYLIEVWNYSESTGKCKVTVEGKTRQ